MRADLALIRRCAEALAPYADDPETFLDTLDGEVDVLDLIDAELAGLAQDEALVDAIKAQRAALADRAARLAARAEAHRANLAAIMQAIGQAKVERPAATVSRRPDTVSVEIASPGDIPSQLMREIVKREPDKAAIKAQLLAGEDVPGAVLAVTSGNIAVRRT